jgi:hypothetical protein
MAQTNYTPISLYYSTTASAVPTAANLVPGELAINTNDGKLYYEDSSGVVQVLASKATSSGTFTTISVSGVATFSAGTVALPAITTTGDTNTGIFFPAADTIAFTEGGAESMRIDSSGNVGIGTSSPAFKTEIVGGATTTETTLFQIRSDGGGIGTGSTIAFANSTNASAGSGRVEIAGIRDTSSGSSFVIRTADSGGTIQNRVKVDESGSVLIGATASASDGWLSLKNSFVSKAGLSLWGNTTGDTGTQGLQILKYDNDTTTSQVFVRFIVNNGGSASGQINANGASSAAFGSWSDSRLKENIVNLPSQLSNILALRPVEFDYIQTEGGGHQIGFIAQEVNKIYPDLVGQRTDGMFTLTDMNKNDARLIKCIQEMHTLITTQQALIESLTTRLTALESK